MGYLSTVSPLWPSDAAWGPGLVLLSAGPAACSGCNVYISAEACGPQLVTELAAPDTGTYSAPMGLGCYAGPIEVGWDPQSGAQLSDRASISSPMFKRSSLPRACPRMQNTWAIWGGPTAKQLKIEANRTAIALVVARVSGTTVGERALIEVTGRLDPSTVPWLTSFQLSELTTHLKACSSPPGLLAYNANATGSPLMVWNGSAFTPVAGTALSPVASFSASASLGASAGTSPQYVAPGYAASMASSPLPGVLQAAVGTVSTLAVAFTGNAENQTQHVTFQLYNNGAPVAGAITTPIAAGSAAPSLSVVTFAPVSYLRGDSLSLAMTPDAALSGALSNVMGSVR